MLFSQLSNIYKYKTYYSF